MPEKTLIMIKPDHVDLADMILSELDKWDAKRIRTARVESVPQEVIEAHYAPHVGKSFFGYMTQSFIGRPVVIAVYEGDGVIGRLAVVIGPTDPAKAPANTIRGKYSNDSLDAAIKEGRPVKNVIHRSDSAEEAAREIEVWKQYLDHR